MALPTQSGKPKIPRRPPGGASLLPPRRKPKARPSYTVDDAMADTRGRATPIDGKAFGTDKGFGVYRGKFGKLTYKGTGKTQGAPQKPTTGSGGGGGGGGASAPAGEQSQAMKDISGYYLGLADLLKGIGPGIGTAYGDAASQIAGFGQGFSGDFRDRMTANADATQNQIERVTGNYLTDATEAKARGGYDIGAAADVGYGLSAYLPAKSLSEQGAAFQAAAGFLPAAAGQQGLYALAAQGRAEEEARAKAAASGSGEAKASASLSKALGYLVDSYGRPILNAKGKPIPLPEQGLTPYQEAQLEMSERREERYISNENFDRWKAEQDINFRNAQEGRRVRADLLKGKQIDSAASKVRGFIVYKDGSIPKGKNGKNIPIAATASSSSTNPYQKAFKAIPQLRGKPMMADPDLSDGKYIAREGAKGVFKDGTTNDPKKAQFSGHMNWQEASAYLQEAYGITKAQARKALVSYGWLPSPAKSKPKSGGAMPRPNMSTATIPQLRKWAIEGLKMNPAAVNNVTDIDELRDLVLKVESMRKGN